MSQQTVKTFYLQMLSPPNRSVSPPREGVSVVYAQTPPVAYYRFLYETVGAEYGWTKRGQLADDELAREIHDPLVEIHVLMVDGVPAGFAELDRRVDGEIELLQFGLMPEFIGQGLGKYFLHWTIHKAWSLRPRRFWLHTCTKDHPAALPLYWKAGFTIYDEEVERPE